MTSKGLALEQRISYIQERTAYMIGFGKSDLLHASPVSHHQVELTVSGFLATFVTSFSTTLVNMAIFALIYPFVGHRSALFFPVIFSLLLLMFVSSSSKPS